MSIAALFAVQLLFPTVALLVIGVVKAERDLERVRVASHKLGLD